MKSSTFKTGLRAQNELLLIGEANFFSRNLICLHNACVQLFRAKIFAFREEKTLVESGLKTATCEDEWRRFLHHY